VTDIYPPEEENEEIEDRRDIGCQDGKVEDAANARVRSEKSVLETDLGALEAKCHTAC